MSSTCPVFAGGCIPTPHLFIGRQEALDFLTHRMSGLQLTSVNVHGELAKVLPLVPKFYLGIHCP